MRKTHVATGSNQDFRGNQLLKQGLRLDVNTETLVLTTFKWYKKKRVAKIIQ